MNEVEELRQEVARLRHELDCQRRNNETRNRQLDALGVVWCSGGCPGGMGRYEPDREVTAQMVADLLVNARRALAWYVNHAGKMLGGAGRIAAFRAAREHVEALLPPMYRRRPVR